MSIPASQTPRQPDSLPLKLYATLLEAGSPLLELYLRRRLRGCKHRRAQRQGQTSLTEFALLRALRGLACRLDVDCLSVNVEER